MYKQLHVIIIYLLLTGCGFVPLYHNSTNIQVQSITIKKGADIAQEQKIKQIIRDYFHNNNVNSNDNNQCYLDLSVKIVDTPALIQKNATTSRLNIKVSVEYTLYNKDHIKTHSDTLELIDGYDIEYNLYSNYTTDNQMKLQLIQNIVEELYNNVQLQLIGYKDE